MKIAIAGAGGFIGGHLAAALRDRGDDVRAIDIKPLDSWYQRLDGVENLSLDVRELAACQEAVAGADWVFNLACDMGGMGFIETNRAACMVSVLINTNMLRASKEAEVGRYFYSSSACVYPLGRQDRPDILALKESDAYPADPEDGYGWEKLFSERMCRHFAEDYGMDVRIVRYHNVYGPHGAWRGGREKAPAAIARKAAEAALDGQHEIEIWGDGQQTRSFLYIEDCIHGTLALMESDYNQPLNLGSAEMVTVDQLVDTVEAIAGVTLERRYDLTAPKGVRGRSSDNTLIEQVLGWSPQTSLREGMTTTYGWIHSQMAAEREPAATVRTLDSVAPVGDWNETSRTDLVA